MNHRPFEDWLLDDQLLTPDQARDLQAHLRDCDSCSAIAESNLALRSARLTSPAPGFSARWQQRLVAARKAQRRRARIGSLVFALGGLVFLALLIGPTLISLIASPARWLAAMVTTLLYIYTLLAAVLEAGSVLFRVLPDFMPPFVWLVLVSAISGLALLGSVSIWRLTRLPQGVQE
jgi:anti-sigma factor RsiW